MRWLFNKSGFTYAASKLRSLVGRSPSDPIKRLVSLLRGEDTKAFSLIELALILLVLSFITVVFIESNEQKRTIGKQAIAYDQVEAIQDAIETYAKAFGYYPCPANPAIAEGTPGFGTNPDSGTGLCDWQNNNLEYDDKPDPDKTTGKGVVMGMVPVRDLSIPFNNAYDTWGNKLMYAITEELTFTLAATGQIKILKDYPETPDNIVTENAVYVILSYGEDGIGAYKRDGSGPISPMAMGGAEIVDSEEQLVNHHIHGADKFDNIFLRYYTHDPDVQFDDQLTWISRKVEPCKNVKKPWDYDLPIATLPQSWLDAAETETMIMNNGDAVSKGNFATWCDKSAGDTLPAFSYGKNFASRPYTGEPLALSESGLNTVRFDGVGDGMLIDDVLNLSGSPTPDPYTIFVVNRYYNPSPQLGRSLQGRDNPWWLGLDNGTHGHFAGSSVSSDPATADEWYISAAVNNSGTSSYFGNGRVTLPSTNSTNAPGRLGLATGAEPNGSTAPSSVDIAEVLVFDSVIDVNDYRAVEDYLSDKWDICLGDKTLQSGDCLCPDDPNMDWDRSTVTCTCKAGLVWDEPSGTCITACGTGCNACQNSGGTWDNGTETCTCNAPRNVLNGSVCECPGDSNWNGSACVTCSTSQVWNGSACGCPSGAYAYSGNTCYCNAGTVWNGSSCSCPSGLIPVMSNPLECGIKVTPSTSGWVGGYVDTGSLGCASLSSAGEALRISAVTPNQREEFLCEKNITLPHGGMWHSFGWWEVSAGCSSCSSTHKRKFTAHPFYTLAWKRWGGTPAENGYRRDIDGGESSNILSAGTHRLKLHLETEANKLGGGTATYTHDFKMKMWMLYCGPWGSHKCPLNINNPPHRGNSGTSGTITIP